MEDEQLLGADPHGRTMSNIYEQELLLGSEHVDCFRRLRVSTLFELMQVASIRHTTALGMGREKTLDRGLLWVVARQYAAIERMPVYDERVTLRSWPGETMHVLFPRYYELVGRGGETLARGSALWSLMDRETRETVFPEEHGVAIAGVETGRETPYLMKLSIQETPNRFSFTVPYSYVDLNGHMNNTRYFDIAEDELPAARAGKRLREARAEYSAEAPLGATLDVAWGEKDGTYFLCGADAETGRRCFRMGLTYDG